MPSHWHDTVDYQVSQAEHDRGIKILDKKQAETLLNMPFRHIKLIGERDVSTLFGLKKAIRLCKNVKSDAINEGTDIALPSFDIASAMYHADQVALAAGNASELAILAETQRHLDVLARNEAYTLALRVPDNSRAIFDTAAKFQGLINLSIEMDDLAVEVAKEQNIRHLLNQSEWSSINETLRKSYIAAA